ncbi:MAG: nuclear transport factor 2 family protein [Clostridia bacterium]|nr:nuclear transport factor 2 family protein [Clostridia bacterium]
MTAYDFSTFPNVKITGIDFSILMEEQLSVLYQAARYCEAMTEADIDTMREIVSEDMTFTHMSGMRQTREEYFADVADGSLRYYAIGMEKPVVKVDGDHGTVTYTSVLNANAYGARGTFRMKGTHHYEKRDGAWIAVNP